MPSRRENDNWLKTGLTIESDATESKTFDIPGADVVTGRIDRSSSYSVDIVYLDPAGNKIDTESVASSTTGLTEFNEDVHSPNTRVEVSDESSSSDDASIAVQIR